VKGLCILVAGTILSGIGWALGEQLAGGPMTRQEGIGLLILYGVYLAVLIKFTLTDVPLSGLFFGLDFALIFCSVVLSLIYDIYACIFSLT
jgi:hypothetical protein